CNAPYRAFCERRGVTPATIASWEDVPPVPTAAFRHADLTCGPPEAVFLTSGTSGGAEARGRHLVPHLDLYRASALTTFTRFLLPDGARLPALFLLPPASERPESSLVRMCDWVAAESGADAEWFAGVNGLDVRRVVERLRELEACGEAVLVAGPTRGFARLFTQTPAGPLRPAAPGPDTRRAHGLPPPHVAPPLPPARRPATGVARS